MRETEIDWAKRASGHMVAIVAVTTGHTHTPIFIHMRKYFEAHTVSFRVRASFAKYNFDENPYRTRGSHTHNHSWQMDGAGESGGIVSARVWADCFYSIFIGIAVTTGHKFIANRKQANGMSWPKRNENGKRAY